MIKNLIIVVMGLALVFGAGELFAASDAESLTIKKVLLQLESDDGVRVAQSSSDLVLNLTRSNLDSRTDVSEKYTGSVELKDKNTKVETKVTVSKIVTPARFIGSDKDEVLYSALVEVNGKEVGRLISAAGSLNLLTLIERGAPVKVNGAFATPVVSVEFSE